MKCGCNGIEYANACLAIQAGVVDYTYGVCPDGNRNEITLAGDLNEIGQPNLTWSYRRSTSDVRFQELRQRAVGTTEWQPLSRTDQSRTLLTAGYRSPVFLIEAMEYQLVAVTEGGEAVISNTFTLVPGTTVNSLQLSVYPNPVTATVLITSNREGTAELRIIGAAGNIRHQESADFSGSPVRIDVSNQVPGVYTVQLSYADGSVAYQRFVKQ